MKQSPARRPFVRAFVTAAAIVALAGAGLMTPGTAAAAGSIDGKLVWIKAQIDGPCHPGNLSSTTIITGGEAINETRERPIDLIPGTGSTIGCIAMQNSPGLLIIADGLAGEQVFGNAELFLYSTIAARTTASFGSSSPNAQVSFDLPVTNMVGQPDYPGNFLASGQIFVGEELMAYSSRTTTPPYQFHITKRGLNGIAPPHDSAELVRANNRLKLRGRNQPTYIGAPTGGGASHGGNSVVKSPHAYLSCRARLSQSGSAVTSRSRCYGILEPGYSGGPMDPFWPDVPPPVSGGEPAWSPYPGPVHQLPDSPYHDLSSGTLSGSDLHLETDIEDYVCFPQIEGLIWVKATTDITITKATYPPRSEDRGAYRVTTYRDACVTPALMPVMGASDNPFGDGPGVNISATLISPASDSDGDGCSDKAELGVDGDDGGLRDPFNKWDRYDVAGPGGSPTPDGVIDLSNDILGVILNYSPSGYLAYPERVRFDREPDLTTGPGHWNRLGADGVIDLANDILGVILQYHPAGCSTT